MRRRLTAGLCLALLAAAPAAAPAATAPPVRLGVDLGPDARLGAATSLSLDLSVAARLGRVTELRLLLPSGLALTSSRLGVAACRRPATEIRRVWTPLVHHRCPGNSLLGRGSTTAGLLLDPEQTIFGGGVVELHAGGTVDDKPGLLVTVDTYNPARMQFVYAGYLYVPPAPFGVGMAIKVPDIPRPPLSSQIALSTLHLAVGESSITYHRRSHGRIVAYRPGGIPLTESCGPAGLRFRTILRFATGVRRQADAVVPCPPQEGR